MHLITHQFSILIYPYRVYSQLHVGDYVRTKLQVLHN